MPPPPETRLIEITSGATGFGEIKIDGKPVEGVTGVDLKIVAGKATHVTLHMVPRRVIVNAQAYDHQVIQQQPTAAD